MIQRWAIEKIFVSNGWEPYEKTEKETVLCKDGEEIYVSNDSVEMHPYDDDISIKVKLNNIEFTTWGLEATEAEVRITA